MPSSLQMSYKPETLKTKYYKELNEMRCDSDVKFLKLKTHIRDTPWAEYVKAPGPGKQVSTSRNWVPRGLSGSKAAGGRGAARGPGVGGGAARARAAVSPGVGCGVQGPAPGWGAGDTARGWGSGQPHRTRRGCSASTFPSRSVPRQWGRHSGISFSACSHSEAVGEFLPFPPAI